MSIRVAEYLGQKTENNPINIPMKTKFYGFILALIVPIVVQAQDIEIGNNYFFISSLGHDLSKQVMKEGKSGTIKSKVEIRQSNQVKVVDLGDERVFFRYLKFASDESEKARKDIDGNVIMDSIGTILYKKVEIPSEENLVYNEDSNGAIKVFSMSRIDFEKFTKPYYNRFRGFKYGIYTVPIRLRSSEGKFEFDANLSVGANVIGRIGSHKREHRFVDLSVGMSITKINLNKENSDLGKPDSDYENLDALSPTAFTFSFGALINLSKNINLGAYVGWDTISSADQNANWIYNGMPWLGLGINVSFAGGAEDSGKSSNQKK